MRMRVRRMGRPEASRREQRHRRHPGRSFRGPRLRDDGFTRDSLLEQQLGCPDAWVRVEPVHERVVADDVGQGHERHALVMAEERPHDVEPGSGGRRAVWS